MAYTSIVLENTLVCVATPLALRQCVFAATGFLQDRPMFSIKLCYVLSASSGIAMGLTLMANGGILSRETLSEMWQIYGTWHHPRAYRMIASNIGIIRDNLRLLEPSVATSTLFVFVAAATLFNVIVAILGWRSLSALRGIAAHALLMAYYCAATVFVLLLVLWVLHWLNFWAFLILFFVVEMSRREESGPRLSF